MTKEPTKTKLGTITFLDPDNFRFIWIVEHLNEAIVKTRECETIQSPIFQDCRHRCDWLLELNFISLVTKLSLILSENHDENVSYAKYFFEYVIFNKKNHKLYKRGGSCVVKQGSIATIDLIKKSDLFNSTYDLVVNETLRICCTICTERRSCYMEDIDLDPSFDLFRNLEHSRSYILTDVTLVTEDKRFPTHKIVLASKSIVFLAMFKHDMLENTENNVEIKDFKAATIQEMLNYMYTGNVNYVEDEAYDLLKCAHKYVIQGLVELCEMLIGSSLSSSNVFQSLALANLYSCNILKSKVYHYVRTHRKDVIETQAFKELSRTDTALSNEILCKVLLYP